MPVGINVQSYSLDGLIGALRTYHLQDGDQLCLMVNHDGVDIIIAVISLAPPETVFDDFLKTLIPDDE